MRNRHWGADEDCSSTDGDGVSYARFFSYTAPAMITAVLHTCI